VILSSGRIQREDGVIVNLLTVEEVLTEMVNDVRDE
jgi:hypothetical protein